MATDPIDDVAGLTSTDDVSKAGLVSYEKARNVGVFTTAAEVRTFDLSARTHIVIGQRLYRKDTEDVSADDLSETSVVVIDAGGNHWVWQVNDVGIAINAVGTYSGRSSHNSEVSPDADGDLFVYLSTNGDGGSITDPVLFVKLSNSNSWSSAIRIRGAQGGQRYEVTNFDSDTPGSAEVIFELIFTQSVTFPSGFSGSRAKASTAATALSVYTIKKNGSSIGTLTFASSGTTGTFAMASSTTFAAGDILRISAPSPADATLAGVKLNLVGTS